MLKIDDITFSYPRKREPVLSGISLSIESGGIYGLLGRNGVGKSTLLYLICGLLNAKRGKITLFDTDTRLRKPKTLSDIILVPEVLDLPNVKLKDYVDALKHFYPHFSHEDMSRYLSTFDMPADVNLGQLSMGQAKKVYMSLALAANTPLVLMDEPTNGLDIPGKAAFRSFVASGMTDERAVVISTHQVTDINRLLDHVIVMENSGVLLNESVDQITSRLAFDVVSDSAVAAQALFSIPSIEGFCTVSENPTQRETQLNLETLFGLTISKPDLIKQIFSTQTPPAI